MTSKYKKLDWRIDEKENNLHYFRV
jgi:hypothetical protein